MGDLRESRMQSAQNLLSLAKQLPNVPSSASAVENKLREGEDAEKKSSRWVISQKPGVCFDDVAGLHETKEIIRRRILYPFQHPEVTARYNKRIGGGVLMYGPPGTGKTMLAKAIATELDATFFSIKCSDIMSKWVGQAEKNLHDLFAEARSHEVSVIFLDETEAIVAKRGGDSTIMNRVIPEFLAQVDGVDNRESALLLLGATNRPWDMDEAALRPGRFGELVYIGLPDLDARRQILQDYMNEIPMEPDLNLDEIAKLTDGFTGADLVGFIERATDRPYTREVSTGNSDRLTEEDCALALQETQKSVTESMLNRYEKFRENRS